MSSNKSTTRSNNFLSNLVTIVFIFGICIAFGQEFIPTISNTRQFNAFNNQARLNAQTSMKLQQQQAKLDRKQARYEAATARAQTLFNGVKHFLIFLFNALLFIVLVGAVGLLIFYLVRLARKSTQSYFEFSVQAQHELKLERELTKRLQYQYQPSKGMFEGLTLSGNLTYNPSTRTADNHSLTHSYTQHSKAPKALGLDQPQTLEATFSPVIQQTFKDLLQLPTPQNHLALGYDMATSEPVYIPLASQALGAISGGGKSSTLTALAAQLPKASIVLCDSHRDSEQGLTNKLAPVIDRLAIDSAESLSECREAMAWTLEEFNIRRTSGNPKESFSPLIFCADEWLALLRDSELAAQAEHLAHTFIQEGRKFNCHIWVSGQSFKAKHSSDAHHAIGQKIIGKMDTKQARMLSGMSADLLPKDTLFLNAGESYLVSWNDPTPQKVYTPYADLSNFQSTFNPLSAQPENMPLGFIRKSDESQESTVADTPSLSTEHKRLLKLIKSGMSIRAAIKEVFAVSSGSRYNAKLEEITQIIRERMTA